MIHLMQDLLEGDWDCAFHCANPHVIMGSGIAYFLRKKWPEVYAADVEYDTQYEFPHHKLGTFSKAIIPDGRWIYNLYGQMGVGNDGSVLGRNCQYDHLYNAMFLACEEMCRVIGDDDNKVKIGVPWGMGSMRAGGSWKIVEALLGDLGDRFPIEIIIYKLDMEDDGKSSSVIPKNNV